MSEVTRGSGGGFLPGPRKSASPPKNACEDAPHTEQQHAGKQATLAAKPCSESFECARSGHRGPDREKNMLPAGLSVIRTAG